MHPVDRRLIACGLCVAFLPMACSTRYLPPPRTPARVVPTAHSDLPAPVAGYGQVTFDAVRAPARVEEITEHTTPAIWSSPSRARMAFTTTGETLRPVCETPCVVHLPVGPHEMRFSALGDDERTSTAFVNVGVHPVIFRHALGRHESFLGLRIGGIFALAGGIAAMTVGGALTGIGSVATDRRGAPSDSRDGIQQAGIGTLIGGGITTVLGVLFLVLSRPREQPGASTQWTPEDPEAAPSQ